MTPQWMKEVLASNDNYILIDAPRQSGKTTVGIEWALKQSRNLSLTNYRNKKVLYLCANRPTADFVYHRILEEYDGHINGGRLSEMSVQFKWAGTIHVMSATEMNRLRGARYDAIVFDEPNRISPECYMEAMMTTSGINDKKVLAVSTGFQDGASEVLKGLSEYVDVKYIFGEHDNTRRTNKDYVVLLRK